MDFALKLVCLGCLLSEGNEVRAADSATSQVYSNGISEEILGKAIKKYNLPRDEIVVMTKVSGSSMFSYRRLTFSTRPVVLRC